MSEQLFLTGLYRSGTTLTDRWLSSHPQVAIFSQPSPFLWIEAKRQFQLLEGIERHFPFGTQVQGEWDDPRAFAHFLHSAVWPQEKLDELVERQVDYTGLGTPWLYEGWRPEAGTSFEVWQQLIERAAQSKPEATVIGAKEIVSEDLAAHLLGQGAKVLLVVRHPADVLASTVGGGQAHVGAYRPMLYTLRMWRRSVAELLRWKGHPNFRYLKYEDLMGQTSTVAHFVANWLQVDKAGFPPIDGPLVDPRGEVWAGNASEQKTELSEQHLRLIEALCGAELRALGYELRAAELPSSQWGEVPEPVPVQAKGFAADYSSSPAHIHWERERYQLLGHPNLSESAAERWYIHPQAYAALRHA